MIWLIFGGWAKTAGFGECAIGLSLLLNCLGRAWLVLFQLEWTPYINILAMPIWLVEYPIFIFVNIATAHSVNLTDGLDGLAGGTLLVAFGAYGAIAMAQGRYDLATFCGVIIGALLAFLWFNINPARFFMGDTGSMSLGVTLGIIAMLTNAALFLPIIGFIFVIEYSVSFNSTWFLKSFWAVNFYFLAASSSI
jgi:phospho-N-acetylmuramoyl-pentapeptide-transferase